MRLGTLNELVGVNITFMVLPTLWSCTELRLLRFATNVNVGTFCPNLIKATNVFVPSARPTAFTDNWGIS